MKSTGVNILRLCVDDVQERACLPYFFCAPGHNKNIFYSSQNSSEEKRSDKLF